MKTLSIALLGCTLALGTVLLAAYTVKHTMQRYERIVRP